MNPDKVFEMLDNLGIYLYPWQKRALRAALADVAQHADPHREAGIQHDGPELYADTGGIARATAPRHPSLDNVWKPVTCTDTCTLPLGHEGQCREHHHHYVMTNSALIEGLPPVDLRWLCTTCKATLVKCHACGRVKGCTVDCEDMNCEHCYCYRDGRDG